MTKRDFQSREYAKERSEEFSETDWPEPPQDNIFEDTSLGADYVRVVEQRDTLLNQLPEGMKHCTIVFKECPQGHGSLTATNWVQHDCNWCEIERLRARVAELEAK